MFRVVLQGTGDGSKGTAIHKAIADEELFDTTPHVQPLGYASRPKESGNPAILCYFEGNEEDPFIMAVGTEESVSDDLKPGESMMFSETNHSIHMKEDGNIDIKTGNGGDLVTIYSSVEVTEDVTVNGDINCSGDVSDYAGTLDQVRKDLANLEARYSLHFHTFPNPSVPGTTLPPGA